jgi:hypothetical protein
MKKSQKRKHYKDLSIDEPASHIVGFETIEAEVNQASREQLTAWFEEAWFTNPGGHFRRRIVKKYERAGLAKIVVMPDGSEQLRFADPSSDNGLGILMPLLEAVDFVLDEPYDPDRTRADYECANEKREELEMSQLENDLRSARPRLICVVEAETDKYIERRIKSEADLKRAAAGPRLIKPSISDVDPAWDECLDEGYIDVDGTPLGPFYFRIVTRANKRFYLVTFMAPSDLVRISWGPEGLAHCDPAMGFAMACIETRLPKAITSADNIAHTFGAGAQIAFLLSCGGDVYAMRAAS